MNWHIKEVTSAIFFLVVGYELAQIKYFKQPDFNKSISTQIPKEQKTDHIKYANEETSTQNFVSSAPDAHNTSERVNDCNVMSMLHIGADDHVIALLASSNTKESLMQLQILAQNKDNSISTESQAFAIIAFGSNWRYHYSELVNLISSSSIDIKNLPSWLQLLCLNHYKTTQKSQMKLCMR